MWRGITSHCMTWHDMTSWQTPWPHRDIHRDIPYLPLPLPMRCHVMSCNVAYIRGRRFGIHPRAPVWHTSGGAGLVSPRAPVWHTSEGAGFAKWGETKPRGLQDRFDWLESIRWLWCYLQCIHRIAYTHERGGGDGRRERERGREGEVCVCVRVCVRAVYCNAMHPQNSIHPHDAMLRSVYSIHPHDIIQYSIHPHNAIDHSIICIHIYCITQYIYIYIYIHIHIYIPGQYSAKW
jgi:hypothetical protein